MSHLKHTITILLCIVVITSLTACSQPIDNNSISSNATQTVSLTQVQQNFNTFLDNLFKESFTNSIDVHFKLKEPEKYDIQLKPELGKLDYGSYQENLKNNQNLLNTLKEYAINNLTQEQQLTYRILEDYLTTQQTNYDFYYYGNAIGYISGLQANYPLIFSEYKFYTEQDIQDYIAVLEQLGGYLSDVGQYLKEQSARGLFGADFIADKAIEQIESITNGSNNLFILSFQEKLNNFVGLDEAVKQQYVEQNNTVIQNTVSPAFVQLSSTITSLKGTGYEGGLWQIPEGKAYYEMLIKTNTGSSKSVDELFQVLEKRKQNLILEVQQIALQDLSIINKLEEFPYENRTSQEMMDILIEKSKNDYPTLDHIDYQIKEVPNYLKDIFVSPAAYIIPPIDATVENTIYVNYDSDNTRAFSTMAHEGYPGHLYQNNYFLSLNKHPILSVMNYKGYTEGWATYTELHSYEFDSTYQGNSAVSRIAALNYELNLLLCSYIDIAVNYYGWDLERMNTELAKLALPEMPDLYEHVVAEPCNYLQYYIGYLEIEELRQIAQEQLGNQFTAKEFNQVLLETGPCSFKIMKEEVEQYIKNKQ